MNERPPSLTVFAPSAHLTVTIEGGATGEDEIHFHAGGQYLWTARNVLRLGEEPLLCTSTGGESGAVLEALASNEGISLLAVRVSAPTGARVHDRRSGSRNTVAVDAPRHLDRHELDDLYEAVLGCAAETEVRVWDPVTGATVAVLGLGEPINTVAWSSTGIAVGYQNKVRVLESRR